MDLWYILLFDWPSARKEAHTCRVYSTTLLADLDRTQKTLCVLVIQAYTND